MHFQVSTRASALFIFLGSSSGRMPSKQKPHCSVCQIGGRRKLIPHPFVSKLSGGTDALICGTCLKDYKNVDWDTKLQNGSHVRNRSADRLRHVWGARCADTSYKNRTFVIHRMIRWHAFRSIRILAPAAGAATRPAAAICFFATSAPTRGARVSVLAASKNLRGSYRRWCLSCSVHRGEPGQGSAPKGMRSGRGGQLEVPVVRRSAAERYPQHSPEVDSRCALALRAIERSSDRATRAT